MSDDKPTRPTRDLGFAGWLLRGFGKAAHTAGVVLERVHRGACANCGIVRELHGNTKVCEECLRKMGHKLADVATDVVGVMTKPEKDDYSG